METPHSLPPPQLLVVSHVAVMLLLLFITERLMLIFALPWLSVLCWLLFTSFSFHAPRPLLPLSLPLHRLRLICNVLFHAFFSFSFFIFILTSLSPSPSPPSSLFPSLLLPLSPSLCFLTLVMSALACFGVTNHPLRNLRAKSKHKNPASRLAAGDDLPCPLPPPVCPPPGLSCPDWRLLLRALSVIGCADDERCSSPKYGLLADRYHFCEKCFNEIQGESVSLGDDPSQPQT